MLKVPVTSDKFFLEAHVKLRPVDLAVDGVYVCGLAHCPEIHGRDHRPGPGGGRPRLPAPGQGQRSSPEPIVSQCRSGDSASAAAPARPSAPTRPSTIYKEDKLRKAQTITASCKGCGVCAARCPTMAIDMGRFT